MNRLWIILSLLFFFSCEDKEDSKDMVISATGLIEITIRKDSTLTGSWDITATDSFENKIGPQIGKGILEGQINNGKVWINLNPRIADYNIILYGNYSSNVYEGKWYLSTFRGNDEPSGNFEINSENEYTAFIER
tara:strand:+ start:1104 stop:1508 length:405 start_codon:yes stop_codon:yes gene_type:complete